MAQKSRPQDGLGTMTHQITAAIDSELFYVALWTCLTLPSVCGALEAKDGKDNRDRYRAWFDKWVQGAGIDGETCYRFRCSALHQASAEPYDCPPIAFRVPTAAGGAIHGILFATKTGQLYMIDLRLFCQAVIAGVQHWLEECGRSKTVRRNYQQFAAIHPMGIPPYIVGVPVVGPSRLRRPGGA